MDRTTPKVKSYFMQNQTTCKPISFASNMQLADALKLTSNTYEMINQRQRKLNLSATAAATMMIKTRDKSTSNTQKPLPDIYITNSIRPIDIRNEPIYTHINQLGSPDMSSTTTTTQISSHNQTKLPNQKALQQQTDVDQMFRYIYSLQQSQVNYQITFFEVPEPIFGDYLTKYASQGYILSEVSASVQTSTVLCNSCSDESKDKDERDQPKETRTEEMVVYSGVWDKNIEDQMWSCHFGKTLEQMIYINKSLQQSEEGCYLATRISKVVRNGKPYFTCIWKVALDTVEYEDAEAENAAQANKMRAMMTFEHFDPEQRKIIEGLDKRDRWKFAYDTIVEFNLNQNYLADLCTVFGKLGYRIDQLVGHEKVAFKNDTKFKMADTKTVERDETNPMLINEEKEAIAKTPQVTSENVLNLCISNNSKEFESDVRFSAIWVKNVGCKKYAFIYNQPHPKFFHKFEECKRLGMSIQSLNVFQTSANLYKFSAVFVQQSTRSIISPFKGLNVDEFMRGFLQMQNSFVIKSFCTFNIPLCTVTNSRRRPVSFTQTSYELKPVVNKPSITSQMQIFIVWQQPGDSTKSAVYQQLRSSYPFPQVQNPYMKSSHNLRSIQNGTQTASKPDQQSSQQNGTQKAAQSAQPIKLKQTNTQLASGNIGQPHDGKPLLLPIMPGHFQENQINQKTDNYIQYHQNCPFVETKSVCNPLKFQELVKDPVSSTKTSTTASNSIKSGQRDQVFGTSAKIKKYQLSSNRQNSAPPRKIKVKCSPEPPNEADVDDDHVSEGGDNDANGLGLGSQSFVLKDGELEDMKHVNFGTAMTGILAWPLPKNKPQQKGNGSMFSYGVRRPKHFKFRSPFHQYLHNRIWEDFMLPTDRVGLAIVYAIEGKIVYAEGFGYADLENKEPMTSNHMMRIASISKEMTDAAISLLVANGKLSVNDRLFGKGGLLENDYKGTQDPEKNRYLHMVTIEHCQKHTCGQPWHNLVDDPAFRLNKLSQHDLLQWVLDNRPLKKRPGGQDYYSNIGYMFLGRVIEKVSGMKYIDFMNKFIMEPIGIKDGFKLAGDYRKDRAPNEVVYYSLEFKSSPYQIKVSRADSAFGLAITPRDCVKFSFHWMRHAHMFRGGINGTQTIIYNTRRNHQCAIFLNTRTLEKPPYKELIEEFGRKIPDDSWPGIIS